MQKVSNTQPNNTEAEAQVLSSPFEEVKNMNQVMAVNVLIQAANAARGAGALSVRDSVLVASAAEFLTQITTDTTNEKA